MKHAQFGRQREQSYMALPEIDEKQFAWLSGQVAAYISGQRDVHLAAAVPLTPEQRPALTPFFRRSTLDSARTLVLRDGSVPNPPFYRELPGMGFDADSLPDFSRMAAITFVDVVVFCEPLTADVLFHELVHVTQYEQLGLAKFAELYVRGFLTGGSYEEIPLEMQAYAMGTRFKNYPAKGFSVFAEVQNWVQEGLY